MVSLYVHSLPYLDIGVKSCYYSDMKKSNRIIVLVDDDEKKALEELAEKMARPYGATMRAALKLLHEKVDPMPRHQAVLYERE